MAEPGHCTGIIVEGTNIEGELRTDFGDDDTTDAAAWRSLDDVRSLRRVSLGDYALTLLPREDRTGEPAVSSRTES